MVRFYLMSLIAIFVAASFTLTGFAQQPDPDSPHVITLEAFARLLERPNIDVDVAAKDVLSEDSFEQLKQKVVAIRQRVARNDSVNVMLENETSGRLEFEVGEEVIVVSFEMTANSPVRIMNISVSGDEDRGMKIRNMTEPLTWDTLEPNLDQLAETGFAGAVLVTRDGEVIFQKGYGFANRDKEIENSNETIFAIGSQPVDFTHVAILKLKDQGKLNLDDPITQYFDDVPQDKRSITLRHLMTGASGFPDFHDVATDTNKDHTWIDRDEAVKRMLNNQLLFEPGTANEHSHSAWGMLAAIVEIVSGESYQDFTRKNLFQPAGMQDTGFFGEEVDENRIAVGYGELKSSEPNSPPHWGTTSWLVMGSGGQVSTLTDILRWEHAVKSGMLLSAESTSLFLNQHNGLASDGDMYGFEFIHSYDPDSLFLLISNSIDSREKRREMMTLGRQLAQLVGDARVAPDNGDDVQRMASKYSLGIQMDVVDNGDVVITAVMSESAADKDGLQVNDRLISANGIPISNDPLAVLGPSLQTGDVIKFVVERSGTQIDVSVTPLKRDP